MTIGKWIKNCTEYAVESRGQKLLVWGDVVHVAAIQFPDPSVTVKYDSDEDHAEMDRMWGSSGGWTDQVVGTHSRHPGSAEGPRVIFVGMSKITGHGWDVVEGVRPSRLALNRCHR
jgi:hypothetical protein